MQLIYQIIFSSAVLYLCTQLFLLVHYYSLVCLYKSDSNRMAGNTTISELISNNNQSANLYAAVIDAGSTGTRLHLFKYKQNGLENFEVENEFFKEVKPGLSGFSLHPERAANSVQELLDLALQLTTPSDRCRTPIVLKATAGLRLLPEVQADNILMLVTDKIRKSGFLVDDNSVAILSGTDEGVFSWFTVNILLDRLKTVENIAAAKAKEQSTVASLDLGGGSTQVTFLPETLTETFTQIDRQQFSQNVSIAGKAVELYTHSYLGGGLIAARIGITKEDGLFNEKYYLSECFPDGYHLESVDYAGKRWSIIGNASSFDGCIRAAKRYIRKLNIRKISELKEKDIYAFSYFYERAEQVKLLSGVDNNHPGIAAVGDYKNAARKACSVTSDQIGSEHWKPWQCLDFSYIYSLLHTGYGLDDTKYIHLIKHYHNIEVSWALGAGYNMMHSYHQRLNQIVASKRPESEILNRQQLPVLQNINVDYINVILRSLTSFISSVMP